MVRVALLVSAFAVVSGCKGRAPTGEEDASRAKDVSSAPLLTASARAASPPPSPSPSLPSPSLSPRGTATLIVQRVETRCMVEPGEIHQGLLGHDVIIEVLPDGETKPKKLFPLCPPGPADGGAALDRDDLGPPRLDMWGVCHAFASCALTPIEAGAEPRAEVRCGKETFVLETGARGTVVRGAFGERVISPLPLRIAPAKRTIRVAHVDC